MTTPAEPHRPESAPTIVLDREVIRRRLQESGWPASDADLDGAPIDGDAFASAVEAAAYAPPLARCGRVESPRHAHPGLARTCACGDASCLDCSPRSGA